MLGALQPFISGACSKTVNMPVSASVQDIYDSLIMSHELGVKCIAIFRAGSKANAVYVVDTPETRMFKANHVWEQLVNAGSDAIDEIIAEASKPRQRKLPGRRLGQTVKFSVGGQLTGYLTVGVYADGTCGEVFGRLGQVGSFASGMFEAYCKLLSTALQFGVPLKEVVKGFRNYSFEPSGFCRVGDDTEADTCTEIRSCACQDSGVAFPGKQRLPPAGRLLHPQRQPSGPGSGYDGKRAAPPHHHHSGASRYSGPAGNSRRKGSGRNDAQRRLPLPAVPLPGLCPGRQMQILLRIQGRRLR